MSWKIVPVSDFLLFFPSSLCLPSLIMIITPSVQASVSGLLRSAVRLSSSQSRCWPFFFHYSVDGHFGWFSVSDVVNRVALKTHVYVSLWNKIFFLNLSPEVGLLDHMVFGAPLVAQAVKNPPAMWETRVRSLGWEGKCYPLQYSGLENSMDCIVHGVAKSWTWLGDFYFHFLVSVGPSSASVMIVVMGMQPEPDQSHLLGVF